LTLFGPGKLPLEQSTEGKNSRKIGRKENREEKKKENSRKQRKQENWFHPHWSWRDGFGLWNLRTGLSQERGLANWFVAQQWVRVRSRVDQGGRFNPSTGGRTPEAKEQQELLFKLSVVESSRPIFKEKEMH